MTKAPRSPGGTSTAIGGFHSVPMIAGTLLAHGMAARRRRTGAGPGARAGMRAGVVVTVALAVALIVLVQTGTIAQPALVMLAFLPTNIAGVVLLAVYRAPRPAAAGEVGHGPATGPYSTLPGPAE